MSSRIKGTDSSAVASRGNRAIEPLRQVAPIAATDKVVEAGNESVHITASARQLLGLQEAIAELPDFDHARVNELRGQIEQQRYVVDAERLASRLLQLEGDLLAAQPNRRA